MGSRGYIKAGWAKWTLLTLGLSLCLAACENDPAEVDALTKKVVLTEEGYNIKALFSQSGNLKAWLTAPHLLRARADTPYAEFPEGVHVDFYRNDGSLENVVIAKYAKHFETLGKVYLQDSVLVYTTLGDTLRTHSLWWDQNQEIYYTNDSVRINTLTQQLVGTGFWAKTNLSKYTITNTKGKVALPEQLDMAPAPVTTPLAQPGTAPVPPPANQP